LIRGYGVRERLTIQPRNRLQTTLKVASGTLAAAFPFMRILYRISPHKPGDSINSTFNVSPVFLSQIEIRNRAFDLAMTQFRKLHLKIGKSLSNRTLSFYPVKRSKGQ
jgi:hypothetical protein